MNNTLQQKALIIQNSRGQFNKGVELQEDFMKEICKKENLNIEFEICDPLLFRNCTIGIFDNIINDKDMKTVSDFYNKYAKPFGCAGLRNFSYGMKGLDRSSVMTGNEALKQLQLDLKTPFKNDVC